MLLGASHTDKRYPGQMEPSPRGSDSVSRAGALCSAVLRGLLLALLVGYPHWVGVWIGSRYDWLFLPLLAPTYSEHLQLLGAWLGLTIALNVLLFRRGRWDRTTRWLQFAAGAVAALALLRIATGAPVLGPQRAWMDLHGWPPELQAGPQQLVRSLYPLFKILLLIGFGSLVVLSFQRLFRLFDLESPARRLAREGLADRGLAGTVKLFRQDAGRAYRVLDRDRPFGPGPEGSFARFFHQAKVVLRGIAVHLTPARRLLFVVSMILAVPDNTRWAAVAGLFLLLLFELVDRIQVRDELDLARELQRDLLPSGAPEAPGWAVAHSYRTANTIGGDYYDFQRSSDGRMALAIGDASGHGMAAALLMAIANATLKAALDRETAPADVVARLNRALVGTGGRKAFMTFFYSLLDLDSGRLDYVCAGHPFPLLRRRDGEILELGTGSLPLGMTESLRLASRSVAIEPGDRLLLYSDGLPEALDGPDGEAFGFGRLRELLAGGGTPQEIHDRILEAFDSHVGDQPLADDVTLVVLHRRRPSEGD